MMNAPRSSPGVPSGDDHGQSSHEPAGSSKELSELVTEIDGLRRALETRPTIDLAKGMVMQRYGCTDVAAFALLRRFSQEHNVKIRDLAAAIVARVDEEGPEAAPAEVVPIAARLFQGPDDGPGTD